MPGLSGASGQGRILYLIDRKEQTITLLMFYTHQDYAKRPPDKVIEKILKKN
jgi:hypothetical protein